MRNGFHQTQGTTSHGVPAAFEYLACWDELEPVHAIVPRLDWPADLFSRPGVMVDDDAVNQ